MFIMERPLPSQLIPSRRGFLQQMLDEEVVALVLTVVFLLSNTKDNTFYPHFLPVSARNTIFARKKPTIICR